MNTVPLPHTGTYAQLLAAVHLVNDRALGLAPPARSVPPISPAPAPRSA